MYNVMVSAQYQGETVHPVCNIRYCHMQQRSHYSISSNLRSFATSHMAFVIGHIRDSKGLCARCVTPDSSKFKMVCPSSSLRPGSPYCCMHATQVPCRRVSLCGVDILRKNYMHSQKEFSLHGVKPVNMSLRYIFSNRGKGHHMCKSQVPNVQCH